MKLRQKLAAVLAATMVVTAVPVVTMAASENGVNKVLTVVKDDSITTGQAVVLKINPEDKLQPQDEFYLELTGGEWLENDDKEYPGVLADFKLERLNGTQLKVTYTGATATTAKFEIPLGVKVTAAETFVTILPERTTLTGEKILVAKSPEASKKLAVSVGDAEAFYTGKDLEVAAIKLDEQVFGEFAKAEDKKITLTLDSDDFEFGKTSDIEYVGTKGFAGIKGAPTVKVVDEQQLEITLPTIDGSTIKSRGGFELKGVKVSSTTKTPETADLKIEVAGDLVDTTDVTVAKVADYDVSLSVKDDKKVEIASGRDAKVTFSMKQTMEDAVVENRDVEFTIENGYFLISGLDKTVDGLKDITAGDPINDDKDDIKAGKWDTLVTDTFTATVSDASEKEFKFEDVKIVVPADVTGDVTITADGRAIGKEVSAVVAEGVAPFEVTTETMMLASGIKEQKGGKIVITETDKAKFEKGEIVISLADERGIEFKKGDINVEATNLKVNEDKVKVVNNRTTDSGYQLVIPVTRTSKEAASITIEGLNVKVDNTVPTGTYDLTIGGNAVANYGDLKVEDFFQVGELGGLVKGTTSFTMGSNKYTINGVEKEMDATPFVSAKGRTMVPVRYLGQALGADVQFINGTVIIKAGATTITVANNSNIAYVNGSPVTMDEKVQIVNNRTYAPASQIGNILGVEPGWDQATQTATFTCK